MARIASVPLGCDILHVGLMHPLLTLPAAVRKASIGTFCVFLRRERLAMRRIRVYMTRELFGLGQKLSGYNCQ